MKNLKNTAIKYFLVSYCIGEYEDWRRIVVFITDNENVAINYCKKFNNLHDKWKKYYTRFEDKNENGDIQEEYIEKRYEKWNILQEFKGCSYTSIEFRQ